MLGIGIGISPVFGGAVESIVAGRINAFNGGFSFEGQDTILGRAHILVAENGGFSFAGQDATLSRSGAPGSLILVDSGAFEFAGDEMVLLLDRFVTAESGSFAFAGQDATLLRSQVLTAASGSFTFAGQDVTMTQAGSYTGPGDIVGSAFAWYGLRGYSAAYSTGSNPALDIVDQAGANQLTVNILSNGRLDVASINAWVTANSVTTIKVKRMYDQSGNARHLNQATLANMPVLNLTGFGSLPAVVFTGASSHSLSAGGRTSPQPLTSSIVFNGNGGSTQEPFSWQCNHYYTSSGDFIASAGTNLTRSGVTTGSWHAAQSVFNGASGAVYVDSLGAVTGNIGTSSPSSNGLLMAQPYASNHFDGKIAEAGWWPVAFDATQAGNMNSNQHGSNGHNF